MTISFTLNGEPITLDVPPMKRLLDVLREDAGRTGTKYGCGEGECGACTIRLNGEPIMSCITPAIQADGGDVRTVEGLCEAGGELTPLQHQFLVCNGAQCGICTPGFLMTASAHLEAGGATDTETLRDTLAGNICRCTGYGRIFESVQKAGAAQ